MLAPRTTAADRQTAAVVAVVPTLADPGTALPVLLTRVPLPSRPLLLSRKRPRAVRALVVAGDAEAALATTAEAVVVASVAVELKPVVLLRA